MLVMRAIRVVHNTPLYILARQTGIAAGRLSLIERELITASPEERQKIAQALDINATFLFQSATLEVLMGHTGASR